MSPLFEYHKNVMFSLPKPHRDVIHYRTYPDTLAFPIPELNHSCFVHLNIMKITERLLEKNSNENPMKIIS